MQKLLDVWQLAIGGKSVVARAWLGNLGRLMGFCGNKTHGNLVLFVLTQWKSQPVEWMDNKICAKNRSTKTCWIARHKNQNGLSAKTETHQNQKGKKRSGGNARRPVDIILALLLPFPCASLENNFNDDGVEWMPRDCWGWTEEKHVVQTAVSCNAFCDGLFETPTENAPQLHTHRFLTLNSRLVQKCAWTPPMLRDCWKTSSGSVRGRLHHMQLMGNDDAA